MRISLRPEVCDPGIQNFLFNQLRTYFDSDPSFYKGMPEAHSETFMEIVEDLGKEMQAEDPSNMRSKIIQKVTILFKESFPAKEKVRMFMEFFFNGVIPKISNATYGTGLLKKLINLVVENKADSKTRLAAYNLIRNLANPVMREQYESIIQKDQELNGKIVVFKDLFSKEIAESPTIENTKIKFQTILEFSEAVLTGEIEKSDKLSVVLQNGEIIEMKFSHLNNSHCPYWIYGEGPRRKFYSLSKDNIKSIEPVLKFNSDEWDITRYMNLRELFDSVQAARINQGDIINITQTDQEIEIIKFYKVDDYNFAFILGYNSQGFLKKFTKEDINFIDI